MVCVCVWGSLQSSQRRKLSKQSSRKDAQLVIVQIPIEVTYRYTPERIRMKKIKLNNTHHETDRKV